MDTMEERRAKLTIILGTNGTGKTTLLRRILVASNQKCLVVTPHPNEWTDLETVDLDKPEDFVFTGLRRHIMKRNYSIPRLKFFKKGILVFDDCKTFIKPLDEDIEQMMIDRRQNEVDYFYVAHGFTRVPPVFYPYYSEIILFKTNDSVAARKQYLLDYDAIVTAQKRINERAVKNPHYMEFIKGNQ